MKARQVLLFILGVFSLMGVTWAFFPADGIPAGPLTLRFPSYRATERDASEVKVDVDSVLLSLENSFKMQEDTLEHYRRFFFENPDRIYMPSDDYTWLDPFFRRLDSAAVTPVRVVHYGDSQIEMDRMSSDLREALQQRFGGSGTGFFPALANVPSASISRVSNGGFVQYTMYGDSTTQRAGNNRYGILAQVVRLTGGGTITLRGTSSKTAYDRTRTFSRISLVYGRPANGFSASVKADTLRPVPQLRTSEGGVSVMTWDLGRNVSKAVITLSGDAEIYAVGADGSNGVSVDNVPLRGCSGTIFSRISKPLMSQTMDMAGVGLVILQFGGNYMPVASSSKVIGAYCERIAEQIQYFHEVAPRAKILFIGPSDMGTSVNGRIVTRPRLGEMVDSLKATALRNDAAYWDLYRMMGGENSMVQWVKHNPPYAGADYTHFTPAGAKRVGEALSNSILTYYDYYNLSK